MRETSDYRRFLRERLESRCRANPRYSLRAFARDLGVSSARLSEVLNRKQGLSAASAAGIGMRLGLSKGEIVRFQDLVASEDARSKGAREAALQRIQSQLDQARDRYRQLEEDSFRAISDWYHYALLELTATRGFKSNPAWIARRLGISQVEAELAIERLLRLKLLRLESGKLEATPEAPTTTNGVPSEAIRRFNQQILEKASRAISLQSVEERDISTVTVSIRKSDLPLFRERIKRFRRDFNRFAESAVPRHQREEVYSLAIQFFRLSEPEQKGTLK
ncbi:MAG: TIGR02147 family protein [Oligoflexia bacterium]|nr:TIGR02147 family protein [Oligoflexia bacterium]